MEMGSSGVYMNSGDDEDERAQANRSHTSSVSEYSKETLMHETSVTHSREPSVYSARSQESVSILERDSPRPPMVRSVRTMSADYSRPYAYDAYKDVLNDGQLQVKIADLGNACWIVSTISLILFINLIFRN